MDDPSFKATSYNGKSSTASNYIETSATAIFAAAYFKAVRLGLLSTSPCDYKTIAKNAFEGLVNNYTYLDANGDMQIWGSCRSAGLGGGTGTDYAAKGKKYRDGSNEYYLLGYDVPMVKQSEGITEGKVLGGFIMAATEYSQLLKENSMQLHTAMVTFLISGIRAMEQKKQKSQMPHLLLILQQKVEIITA